MVFKFSRTQIFRRIWPLICLALLGIPAGIFYGIYYAHMIVPYLEYSKRVIYGDVTFNGFYIHGSENNLAFEKPHFNGSGYAMGKFYKIDTECDVFGNWFPARRIIEVAGCSECEICYAEDELKKFESGCSRDSISGCRQERQNECISKIIKTLYPKVRGFTNVFDPCEEINTGFRLEPGDVPQKIQSGSDDAGSMVGIVFAYISSGFASLFLLIYLCVITYEIYSGSPNVDIDNQYLCLSIYKNDVPIKSLVRYQKKHQWFRRLVSVVCCTCCTDPPKYIPQSTSHPSGDEGSSTEAAPPSSSESPGISNVPITRPNQDIPSVALDSHDRDQDLWEIPEAVENLRLRHAPGDNIIARYETYDIYKSFMVKPVLPRQIPRSENSQCFLSRKPIRGIFFHCPSCSINVSLQSIFPYVIERFQCPNCENRMPDLERDIGDHLYGLVKYE